MEDSFLSGMRRKKRFLLAGSWCVQKCQLSRCSDSKGDAATQRSPQQRHGIDAPPQAPEKPRAQLERSCGHKAPYPAPGGSFSRRGHLQEIRRRCRESLGCFMPRVPAPKVLPFLLTLLFASGACTATSSRTKALRVSLVTLNIARDTLRAVNRERETQIIEQAPSKEEGRAQLDAWRSTIDNVAGAISDGYDAVLTAAILADAASAIAAGTAVAKALDLVQALRPNASKEPAP